MRSLYMKSIMVALSLLKIAAINIATDSSSSLTMEQTYSEDEAKMMLQYATISFCDAESISNWDCYLCNEDVPELNVAAVVQDDTWKLQAYVGWYEASGSASGKDIIIAFRGTVNDEIRNWIIDARINHISPWKLNRHIPRETTVAAGFYRAWSHLRPGIVAAVKELDPDGDSDIYVTGHSLGGAMATLCTFDLHFEEGINVKNTFTYGQTRTGNAIFADTYEAAGLSSRHWRVTHWKDPVPQYPWPTLDYHHVAREVFYNDDFTQVVFGDGSGESPDGQNSICETSGGQNIKCLNPSDHTFYLNMTTGDKACIPPAKQGTKNYLRKKNAATVIEGHLKL